MALKKISEPITALGEGVDLDTITSTGVYHQHLNVRADKALNYPVGKAGLLEVHTPSVGRMVYQRYTAYNDNAIFHRSRYFNDWSEWHRLI